jgi:hypothetical protein
MDALNNLKKILTSKWDYVSIQGDEQVNLKNLQGGEKKVYDVI